MQQSNARGSEIVLKGAQLQRLFDATPFMLTRCDRDLRFNCVSRAYADMLGRDPGDIEGRLMADVIGPEGLAVIQPYIDRVLAGERVQYESDVPFASIGIRSLRVVYTPDFGERGQI